MTAKQNRAGWRRRGWDCTFEYTAKDGMKKTGKGKRFVIDGIELELFPSPVLCAIMGRELRTLYGWEKDFGFPRAMWRVRDDSRCNRWYSRKQLLFVSALYEHFGRLKGEHRARLHDFIAALRTKFYTCDEPVEIRGKEISKC